MTASGGLALTAGPASENPAAPAQSDVTREKKDLASWWKNFKRGDKKAPEPVVPQGIFGVPLQVSIRYANVAISLFNEEGESYIYGYVPIVVAKCGVFLKEKATDVEGIFRLAGSEKRIKELKVAFDSPDRYGKGLDWTGYTVHDAANILRRYFNQLPEPIIPLEFYQRFRDPLRTRQSQTTGGPDSQPATEGTFNTEAAIRTYQGLITELPPLNRQLLLYILDLLAVFASKSDLNKMTTSNLAAIFQPGILNHPQHDMAPQEYLLSQDILVFLIENQDSFLIGMQGTAADAETVRDVQSGSPKAPGTPPTPTRSRSVNNRSSSVHSSAAAESVRKIGSIRRNVSVSSKHSKRSDVASVGIATPQSGSGVHRSNTVPSRRGGSSAAPSPRFPRERSSGSPSPAPTPKSGHDSRSLVDNNVHSNSVQATPVAASVATFAPFVAPPAASPVAGAGPAVKDFQTPKKDPNVLSPSQGGSGEKPSDRSFSTTPSSTSGRKFLDILKQSPTADGEGRKPNKLQKKRIPGSSLSSAQSSSHSLQDHPDVVPRSPISPRLQPGLNNTVITELPDESTPRATPVTVSPQRPTAEAPVRPAASPAASFHSHADDTSDPDMVGDDMPSQGDEGLKEKKRNRWRFSRSNNKLPSPPAPLNPLSAMTGREHATSRSTIGSTIGSSATSQPRKSFQEQPTPLSTVASEAAPAATTDRSQTVRSMSSADPVFSDSEREKKGPMSWIRGKIQERKDSREAERRSRTPDRSQHERSRSRKDLTGSNTEFPATRNKSFDQPRAEPINGTAIPEERVPAPATPVIVPPLTDTADVASHTVSIRTQGEVPASGSAAAVPTAVPQTADTSAGTAAARATITAPATPEKK